MFFLGEIAPALENLKPGVALEDPQQYGSLAFLQAAYLERAGEIATELAVHFEQGRDYHRAMHFLQRAGENALRRSASTEAITHLNKALELLKTLPDTPERTQQELTLQMTLAVPLAASKGGGALEVGRTYARARELCQQAGDTSQLFLILLGLTGFYFIRAEYQTARDMAAQLLRLARRSQDPAPLLAAHLGLGSILLFLGEFRLARTHAEQAVALYDPQQHSPHTALSGAFGVDVGMMCFFRAAHILWLLGYPTQGLRRSQDALTLARQFAHPWNVAWAFQHTALMHQWRREGQLSQESAEAALALANEHGLVPTRADATILRGWVLAEQGQGEEGMAQIRQGLAIYQATGTEVTRTYSLGLLAEACRTAGQIEEGLCILDEALGLVDKNGERFYEAELYRLKGELTLAQSVAQSLASSVTNPRPLTPSPHAEAQAEACFHKAIAIAHQQSAKSLELRATVSLARLWQRQGRKEEGRQMLADVYGWFTEGFDTVDPQEAKALLAALGGQETERKRKAQGARRKISSSRAIAPRTEKSRSK